MIKRLLFLTLLSTLGLSQIKAQLYNDGATITIGNSATLYVSSNIINQNGGTIQNSGSVVLVGDFTNSATLTSQANSTFTFTGSTNANVASNGASFAKVELSKDAGRQVILSNAMRITEDLNFVSDDNLLTIGTHDLTLDADATVTSADDNEYIQTNSTGQVIKESLATFDFPVGNGSYTPIKLIESGAMDNKGVRVLANPLANGTSGAALTEGVVDAAWVVSESVTGGSNLVLTPQWSASDNLTGLKINELGVSRYDGNTYDLTLSLLGAAVGSSPYTRMRSEIIDVGTFVVGSDPLLREVRVSPKVFLAGPFNGSNMNDDLRVAGLIPLSEPYTAMTQFTHVGRAGGESVSALTDFDAVGTDDDIVDWVFLELRDAADNTAVVATASALIQRDGDIVGTDGNPVNFVGLEDGNYYVVIRHRNHLGIMTNTATALSGTTTHLNFTNGSVTTWGTNAQTSLSSGDAAMWAGDTNSNGLVSYNGGTNDRDNILLALSFNPTGSLNGYNTSDVNLNGLVSYNGGTNDRDAMLLSLLFNPTTSAQQQLPN